jgi:hypothetical protein
MVVGKVLKNGFTGAKNIGKKWIFETDIFSSKNPSSYLCIKNWKTLESPH